MPILPDGRIMMVTQYRYLARKESVEFPCGVVKDRSTYDETAIHELQEETEYKAAKMELAGTFNPYNRVPGEMGHV